MKKSQPFGLAFYVCNSAVLKKIRGLNPGSGESTLTPSFCIWRNAKRINTNIEADIP